MGAKQRKIQRPYYDRYFGPNYFKVIGDDLGELNEYFAKPIAQRGTQQHQNYTSQVQNFKNQPQSCIPQPQNYTSQAQNCLLQAQNYTSQAQNCLPQAQNYTSQAQNYASQAQNCIPQPESYVPQSQNCISQQQNVIQHQLNCAPLPQNCMPNPNFAVNISQGTINQPASNQSIFQQSVIQQPAKHVIKGSRGLNKNHFQTRSVDYLFEQQSQDVLTTSPSFHQSVFMVTPQNPLVNLPSLPDQHRNIKSPLQYTFIPQQQFQNPPAQQPYISVIPPQQVSQKVFLKKKKNKSVPLSTNYYQNQSVLATRQ